MGNTILLLSRTVLEETGKTFMKARIFILFVLLLLPSVVSGEDYIIGDGDVLHISVWGESELNFSIRVRPDGKITIPASGEVKASGLSPLNLQALLTKKLKRLVKNPVVTVIVEEINNNKIYVFGGGVNPGVYDLNRKTTLLRLLTQIGDIRNADLRKAYVLRKGKNVKEDFHDLFINGDISRDIVIKPDDVIFIPALAEKNVYVVGAVNEPKFIEYREGLTVMEAILDAEGFTKFARQNDTVILRRDGKEEILIPVKVKDLIKDGDLSQNVKLRPGDYVIVKEGIL